MITPEHTQNLTRSMSDWKQLLTVAQSEVQALMAALPEELRRKAETVPVTYDPRHREELRTLNLEETLGLFVGNSHLSLEETQDLPPQIILFLKNIWAFAEMDEATYRQEVRTTYLHELGHYLGLEEVDLEERGLL